MLAHCLSLTLKFTHGGLRGNSISALLETQPYFSQGFLGQFASGFCAQTHVFISLYISSLNEAQISIALIDLAPLASLKISGHIKRFLVEKTKIPASHLPMVSFFSFQIQNYALSMSFHALSPPPFTRAKPRSMCDNL